MTHFVSRCVGMMAAGISGSAYYRYSHSNPGVKRVAARIYPTARASRFPYSNPIQTVAARIYPIGRAFLDTAYRMIKSWVPKMPVLASFTYVNVEKIEGQKKIERIIYPFLFRVTGKDILPNQKVYLLGMNHGFKEADYPPEALALINGCGLLLSEAPVNMANVKEWALNESINTQLNIYKKLLSADREWIGTFLSAYESEAWNFDIDALIRVLKEKNREIKADQACWLDRIPLADQTKIQTLLDEHGIQLRDLDPPSVSFWLALMKDHRAKNYDFNTGEVVMLNNFQKRNCPIVELETTLSRSASFFIPILHYIVKYDLESTVKDILLKLEPQVKKIDAFHQKLQEVAGKDVPFSLCEDDIIDNDSLEALERQLEKSRQRLLRLILDRMEGSSHSILDQINSEELKTLLGESLVTDLNTLYRNNTSQPKIPLADECIDNKKCVEFKTGEALRNQVSLIQEACKLDLLRSIVDDKIYFDFEEYEAKWLKRLEKDWTIIYRNTTWYPKIPLAIQQKKDMALTCGAAHLIGETGMVRSLRRDGYNVNHVKAIEE